MIGKVGLAVLVVAALALVRCANSTQTSEYSKGLAASDQTPKRVAARTILPKSFKSDHNNKSTLEISCSMARVGKISRPRAEVRSGPGSEFPLKDFLFQQDTDLMMFDQLGVWTKVIEPKQKRSGWIHRQTIRQKQPSCDLVVDSETLPRMFALRPIKTIFDFETGKPISVEIEKSEEFPCLKFERDRALIWLSETNSVVWFARSDLT